MANYRPRKVLRQQSSARPKNDELSKLNQALFDDKCQLVKVNKELSESRQKLIDKTGKLTQINRGLYAQYRGLYGQYRGLHELTT